MPEVTRQLDASADTVYGALTNEEFLVERREQAGDKDIRVSVSGETPRRVEASYSAAPELPAFTRKLFARLIRVRESVRWQTEDNAFVARYVVDVAAGVGSVTGETRVVPVGAGSQLTETFEAAVKFPLFRKKLEALLVEETRAAMSTDLDYLHRRLSPPLVSDTASA